LPRLDRATRYDLLLKALQETVAQLCGAAPAELFPERRLVELGFGSLFLISLAGTLSRASGRQITVAEVMEAATLDGLVRMLVSMRGMESIAVIGSGLDS